MSEGSGQRYCGNCGAEIRSGISFCVSCGASLAPNTETPASTHDAVAMDGESEPEGRAGNTRTAQGESQTARPMSSSADSQSGAKADTTSEFPNRMINWFRDLPSLPKLVLVGVLLMLLLTVLSPVARVVAIIVFVVSAVVLAIRAIQREPLRGWVFAVVGSLVLIPVFGGVSGAIYGGNSGSGEAGESESLYDTSTSPSASDPGGSEPYRSVAPGLEGAAKEWASDIPKGRYILVPSYLPFNVEGHVNDLADSGYYAMYSNLNDWGDISHGLAIFLVDSGGFYTYDIHGTISIDGSSYYYSETYFPICELGLWETSGEQGFRVKFPEYGTGDCIPSEELVEILDSMVRVESSG